MGNRRVKIVILCEDSQHEAFIRRFLEGMGWNKRELRVEKSPSAKGSAEQWVKANFPQELLIYRKRSSQAASALIAVIDADNKKVQDRLIEFEQTCTSENLCFRAADEAVAIAVPKRNIETWIHYLQGEPVDEETVYPKLARARDCKEEVKALVHHCQSRDMPQEAPASLKAAGEEYHQRIRPMA